MALNNSYWFQNTGFYNEVATQSLRFDSGSSPYLTRTPSSAGNKKTWTWSAWIKRASLQSASPYGGFGILFAGGNEQNMWAIPANCTLIAYWINSEQLAVVGTGNTVLRLTSARQRDLSAWYHFVVAMDTTQSTANDRTKVYINGVQQTSFDTTNNVSQNTDLNINETSNHLIGGQQTSNVAAYMNMYLAETNFIDGQALDASYFGETKNGVWIPKRYTGSYGTNGFRLEFKNTSVGTGSSSTVGADTSGNDHHFTSSGIVASDCNMPDSPENNFCTMNNTDLQYNAELLEGNLHIKASTYSGGNYGHAMCTFKIPSSGKWYIEILSRNLLGTGNATSFGIMDRNVIQPSGSKASPNYVVTTGEGFDGLQHQHYIGGEYVAIKVDGVTSGSNISMSTSGNTGSVSALAIDVDNGYLYVGATDGVGGTGSQIRWLDYADGSTGTSNVNPESGSSGTGGIARTFTNNDIISVEVVVSGNNLNKSQIYLNAGQDSSFAGTLTAQGNTDANGVGDFYYVVPSGYLALCTSNLPEPTISPNKATQSDDHFNTVLYTGNQTARSITGVGFQPDWVWFKPRSDADNHVLIDSSRGGTKYIMSNRDDAEITEGQGISSFDSDGFSIGNWTNINENSQTYVAWNWKGNGTTPTKTYKVVVVSDSGNKYRFRNSADDATFAQSAVTLDLQEGGTYTFDLSDSSMSGHPFVFSTTSDGTHGGGSEYTTGVTKTGTAGSAGASIVITVASSAPTLYYYCSNHSGMGGQVNTNDTHGSTNFDGSLLSVSNPNTESGFSIITYTGGGSAGDTIGHGLGSAPEQVWFKRRGASGNWMNYAKAMGNNGYINLDRTTAKDTGGSPVNNTDPSSTVITLGSFQSLNSSSSNNTYVAYAFAPVDGFSKMGSYVGNGSSDGTYVYTEFRPAWVIIKRTDSANNWHINDSVRDIDNTVIEYLYADSTAVEGNLSGGGGLDFLSNGFKIRSTTAGVVNADGGSYVYLAFAEAPFKYSNAR